MTQVEHVLMPFFRLDCRTVVSYVQQIAPALQYVHEHKVLTKCLRKLALVDDFRDGEPSPGCQHLVLVRQEVDDTVGDRHSHAFWGKRDVFDDASQKPHVLHPNLGPVAFGQFQHGVGHSKVVGQAAWTNTPRLPGVGQCRLRREGSSTHSPVFNSASAVGLPPPSDISAAATGIVPSSTWL